MKKIAGVIKKHKILTVLCLAVLVVALVVFLKPVDPTLGYSEEIAAKRDIVTYNSFVGNVGFTDEMNALAMASAEVTEVFAQAGDRVSKGDVLASLDSKALEKNKISIKNQKTANEHSLADAQRAYDNFKYALDNGLNATLNNAKAQLDSAKKNYDTLFRNFEDYVDALESAVDGGNEGDSFAMIMKRKEYHKAVEEYKQLQVSIENLEQKKNNSDDFSENDQYFLDSYISRLSYLETEIAQKRSDYEEYVRNYADYNDPNFKVIVDNLENAQIALENATDGYNSAELQVTQQLETYEATLKKAQDTLTLESLEKELTNLKETLEDYKVVAPCDGIITSFNLEKGNMASIGSVAATVSNLEEFEISIKVDEYSILNTKVGKDVVIYIDSIGKTYDGTITWIASNATIENGVSYFKATVEFTADEYVRGGMSVEVRLTNSESLDSVSVSVDAVKYRKDNTAYVYVLNDNGELEERTVSLGVSDGIYVEITEGISDGEKILYTPSFNFMMPMSGGDFGG